MGSSERRIYGHGNNAWVQARAANHYFRDSGKDQHPGPGGHLGSLHHGGSHRRLPPLHRLVEDAEVLRRDIDTRDGGDDLAPTRVMRPASPKRQLQIVLAARGGNAGH